MTMTGAVVADLGAVRRVCEGVARWWGHYLATGQVDVDSLAELLAAVGDLGAVPGPLGHALRFLGAGCPGADEVEVGDVFTVVAAAGRCRPLPDAPRSRRLWSRSGLEADTGAIAMSPGPAMVAAQAE